MTHSGGKPHETGDRGQRYQVTYLEGRIGRRIFGWSETLEGAERMVDSIQKHPSWSQPVIIDRVQPEQ